MSSALIERYTFGIKNIASPGPVADFFFGIPKRQREMIEITKRQVEVQKASAKYIAESNLQGSEMICREIENQTHVLEKAVGELGGDIVNALDYLGDRISGDLSEIRWELEQLRSISDQILEVLRRPRSTEAQELIRQGVRHLVNNEIVEAEDRLRKALEKDSTDYQVLMNLSYVALHKEQADEAIMLTNKALTLPENLDKQAKADALWSLSRIYYTLEQFDQSYSLAKKAIAVFATPKRLYQAGIYRVLCGNKSEGIALIHQAILQDKSLFVLAATDPDLETARQDILFLLDQLSQNIRKEANQSWQELSSTIRGIDNSKTSYHYTDLLSRMLAISERVKSMIDAPSYSGGVTSVSVIASLQQSLAGFRQLESLYSEHDNLSLELESMNRDIEPIRKELEEKEQQASRIQGGAGSWVGSFFAIFGLFWVVVCELSALVTVIAGGPLGLIILILLLGCIIWLLLRFILGESRKREADSKRKGLDELIDNLRTKIAPLEKEASRINGKIANLTKQIEAIQHKVIGELDSIVKTTKWVGSIL
jgi:tetratricopeptide (TPR) repeat protein